MIVAFASVFLGGGGVGGIFVTKRVVNGLTKDVALIKNKLFMDDNSLANRVTIVEKDLEYLKEIPE